MAGALELLFWQVAEGAVEEVYLGEEGELVGCLIAAL